MTDGNSRNKLTKKGPWITIGSFDGVHIGHQKIINELVDGARSENASPVVITFFPYPAILLGEITSPYYLTLPEEKDSILKHLGVQSILTVKFDHSVSRLSPKDFISHLHNQFKFTCLLIGYDFRMGADREGDSKKLEEIGNEMGFSVRVIAPVDFIGKPFSSSSIRAAVESGDITSAGKMLGRPYSIEGEVIHGDGRGRHIGLPTANISVWRQKLLPANGVYAAYSILDGERHHSVVSIGFRPTFYTETTIQTIESHMLNFSDQIYGKRMKIQFISRLRPEEKYQSVDELMKQIGKDISAAKEVLSDDTISSRISP